MSLLFGLYRQSRKIINTSEFFSHLFEALRTIHAN